MKMKTPKNQPPSGNITATAWGRMQAYLKRIKDADGHLLYPQAWINEHIGTNAHQSRINVAAKLREALA